jgi:hypothetical protein
MERIAAKQNYAADFSIPHFFDTFTSRKITKATITGNQRYEDVADTT